MTIEKINGFWVPSNDVHIEDWKKNKDFTQSRCLDKFIDHCENKNVKFKKGFEDAKEVYKARTGKDKGIEKETGNRILNTICGYCGFRKHCWPNAEMHPKITSRAKAKPIIWYSKLKTKELADL